MERGFGRYGVKRCPRCGAELYADMSVCYGCLYDFARDGARSATACGEAASRSELPPLALRHEAEPGVVVRTSALDVWLPVGEDGASVGRDDANDVVLHSLAVSGCHVRLVPTPDGMEVVDLGSSNRATYHGRAMAERVVVPYGDAVDVCGCLLTMTGPPPIGAAPV